MPQSIRQIIHSVFGKGLDEKTRKFAISGSLGNGGVQLLSMVLVLATQILIARIGGEEAYGIYSQVFNWMAVLFLIAAFGSDLLLVKQIPIYKKDGDTTKMRSLWWWSNKRVLYSSLLAMVVFFMLVNYLNIPGLYNNAHYFNISLVAILLGAFIVPQQAFLRGIKKVVLGSTADKIIKPVGLLFGILFFYFLGKKDEPESYIYANIFALGLAMLYSFFWVFKNRSSMSSKEPLEIENKEWLSRSFQFTLTGLLFMLSIRLDVLLVGSLMNNENVGFYNVALKYADLANVPFFIISHSIAPLFSEFYAGNKMKKLQALFSNSTRIIFLLSLLIFVFFFLFGKIILGFFGDSFVVGYYPLLIISFGKLLSAFIGPIGLLMVLTGHEKKVNLVMVFQIILTSILLFLLIPAWGLLGAAVGASIGFLFFKISLYFLLKKETGLNASIFG